MLIGKNGNISTLVSGSTFDIKTYIDLPSELHGLDLSKCDASANQEVGKYDIGNTQVPLYCFEGNATHAPFLTFQKGSTEANITIPPSYLQ